MVLFSQVLQFPRSVAVALALLPLGLSGCGLPAEPIRLSTASTTGYYYRLGQSIEASVEDTVSIDVELLESTGSQDNLRKLLNGDTDIALVQLDVAEESMKAGAVSAIAILAQEHIHLISRQTLESSTATGTNTEPETLSDLTGRTIAIGPPGSGISFTAKQLLDTALLDETVQINEAGFSDALDLLSQGQVDAAFYVGRLGANQSLRDVFATNPDLTLLSISPGLANFLAIQNPGVYRAATIPEGVYGVFPSQPDRPLSTLTTPTVLVTRPDISPKTVRLLTWSIVATAHQYASFYPELHSGDPNELLRQGLFFVHPDAIDVYEYGDPRQVWVRYWENNSDLQAGIFLLLGTSVIGMMLQYWRKMRSHRLSNTILQRTIEINQLLTQSPQEALREIEELSQDNRFQFIAGKIPDEVYAQVQQKTQTLSDQCRSVLDRERREEVLNTLLLLDEWQETLQTDPPAAISKLGQIKQQYRDMLLSNQVDIQAYMELTELTLISLMTLVPEQRLPAEKISLLSAQDAPTPSSD